jgi:hypothetical protein
MPREPVRTISTSSPSVSANLKIARASSSAPTQNASERGINKGSSLRQLDKCIELLSIQKMGKKYLGLSAAMA